MLGWSWDGVITRITTKNLSNAKIENETWMKFER